MSRLTSSIVAFILLATTAHAQSECSLVYGRDWAFLRAPLRN